MNDYKVDNCPNMKLLSSECLECKLIREDEVKETNKLRQLLWEHKEAKEAQHRKLVGGSI